MREDYVGGEESDNVFYFPHFIKSYSINPPLKRDRRLIVDLTPSYLPVEQIAANSITIIPPLVTPQNGIL